MNSFENLPSFVTYDEVRRALNVSMSTLRRMIKTGKIPPPIKISPNRRGWLREIIIEVLKRLGFGL